jgi:hypothetical protein
MQKPKKEADLLSRPLTEKSQNVKKWLQKWDKMEKYWYIVIARFKHDLRRIKNHPMKNTTHTHKTQYRQF